MSSASRKPRIKRRGVLRFVCGACGFEAMANGDQTYARCNIALGRIGWRIEKRNFFRGGKEGWMPVCNKCATPDVTPVVIETTVGGKVL
jgi:hypothetical protein